MPEYFLPRNMSPGDMEPSAETSRKRSLDAQDGRSIEVLGASDDIRTRTSDEGLEIELPEGQRVLVGPMPAGTVLEIISWKGAGSPGSDASRLLLGTATTESLVRSAEAPTAHPTSPVAPRADIEPTRDGGGTGYAPPSGSRRGRLLAAAVIAAVIAIPVALGLGSWAVVDAGPEWSLGPTRGSIAFVLPGDVTVGDRVLARPEGSRQDWLGFVVEGEPGAAIVRSDQVTLPAGETEGRVLFVVPWVGYPLIWLSELP